VRFVRFLWLLVWLLPGLAHGQGNYEIQRVISAGFEYYGDWGRRLSWGQAGRFK